MPELPEVETVKRTLQSKIVGKRVNSVQVFLPKIILPLNPDEFKSIVESSVIHSIERRGKYLLIRLSSTFTLIISLRMTGQLVFIPSEMDVPVSKHTHLKFEFDDGSHLCFSDLRKFGTIHCIPAEEVEHCPEISKLGPEALGPEFSEARLLKMLLSKRRKVKQLLLDQTFIAGIGNIYADEILFRAGIHPETISNTLLLEQVHRLYLAIAAVLTEAVVQRGTTFRDYVDGDGNAGNYQALLQVYGRKGKKCYHCGHTIETIKLGGRTASFCPVCQREDS